jgi:uncharacterized protein
MFGFSLAKIAVLVAIVAAVWFGFKYYARLEAKRADDRLQGKRRRTRRGAKRARVEEAEAMVQCPVCQVYQPAGDAGACDRADCPY